MGLSVEQQAFCGRLGHEFGRPELLRSALTHPSMSSTVRADNQRLEFLGDRVLGLVMAEAVMAEDLEAPEGSLAPRFNALVRRETLAEVARALDLGSALRLGRSEMIAGGRKRDAALADAMEAVIAAIYLDAGLDAARAVVLRHWGRRVAVAETLARDAKTALQEWAQARRQTPPSYDEIARAGPDHAPVFTIRARLQSGEEASATAGTKRAAEQAAAQALLGQIETDTE
ncbi:MAG: ribonuclease III [Rhodobacteraceae bacterium]|nr:ribonuclease III [Paracoccaceae bacterium]